MNDWGAGHAPMIFPTALPPPHVVLAAFAMATRFELLVWDEGDPARLRAAGEDALAEISRTEARLSRFRPTSEIAWVNAGAGGAPARLSPIVFDLVVRSLELARLTDGAFDPTVGPLLRAWGLRGSETPGDPAAVARARAVVGWGRLELDEGARTVRLPQAGMELDLGGIGKGAALDAAGALLQETGVRAALLHGGTSSVHSLGELPDGRPWRVGWHVPGEDAPRVVELTAERPALAVSAPHGRIAGDGARSWGHVIDPRTGEPTRAARTALVTGPSSTLCDALSTAFLVLGPEGAPILQEHFPAYRAEAVAEIRMSPER